MPFLPPIIFTAENAEPAEKKTIIQRIAPPEIELSEKNFERMIIFIIFVLLPDEPLRSLRSLR
jgi:hypothetical protein